MDWDSLREHWKWLTTALLPVAGWLSRRKGWHPWQSLVRQYNLNKVAASCLQDLDNERRSKDYAMAALREITTAAGMVKEAADQGHLTISPPSQTERSPSRRRSTDSPPPRKGNRRNLR